VSRNTKDGVRRRVSREFFDVTGRVVRFTENCTAFPSIVGRGVVIGKEGQNWNAGMGYATSKLERKISTESH
jgi:hypothetical protein